MRSRTLISLLTVIFLVLLVAATLTTRVTKASPGIRYVSTDGSCGGNNPCYTNVQDALDAADPFDEILVATGIYTDPAGTVAEVTATITLQGGWNTGFTTQNPITYPTTLDAQGNGRVIYISGYISPTIEGFIITGGNASSETGGAGRGGGIYTLDANPIIQNNVITNNVAITSTNWGFGGGLYLWNASALISGNQILSNTASTADNGMGGGLYLDQSAATVSGNTISGNTAPSYGGGLKLYDSSNVTLDGNRIISNTASTGGGLDITFTDPFTMTNNIVAQNPANTVGGGLYIRGATGDHSSGELVNNTFAQNNLGSGGEAIYSRNPFPITLTNNIIVTHTYGIYAYWDCTVTADYTLFYGNTNNTGGGGTITSTHEVSGDPLFVDPATWDYHIQVASAAVNRGTFTGAPSTDFEGDPRPYDCFIDLGADENTASDECKRIYLPLIMKNY